MVFESEISREYPGRELSVPPGTYEATLAGIGGTTTKQIVVGANGATLTVE